MKTIKLLTLIAAAAMVFHTAAAQQEKKDWAQYGRYAQANAELKEAPRAVFMGNSITDGWPGGSPEFWKEHPDFAGRGIGGQTSLEMLCRFRQDVINLHPKVVCILAGTNDIAENDGYIAPENILGNIVSMVELARANKIKVAVCSVLPCDIYLWRQEIKPAEKIKKLNSMLKNYVDNKKDKNVVYVDYYSVLDNGKGGIIPECTSDHCHLTPAGYKKLEAVIVPVINKLAK
mgnify:CR=1 FL=1